MRSLIPVFALLCLVSVTLSGCSASASTGAPSPTRAPTSQYLVMFTPLNDSGVSGRMHLDLTGTTLVVTLQVSGLVPNREHYAHIHGTPGGAVTCPTPADADPSGRLSVDQGLAIVGPIALDLSPYPQVTGSGITAWSQTYALTAAQVSSLTPLTGHVVVLHGLAYQGVYDRALFVACGPIRLA